MKKEDLKKNNNFSSTQLFKELNCDYSNFFCKFRKNVDVLLRKYGIARWKYSENWWNMNSNPHNISKYALTVQVSYVFAKNTTQYT